MSFQGIEEASRRINGIVNKTPVMTSRTLNLLVNAKVYFKCENFQKGGAFKFRGVSNKFLQLNEEDKAKGVITHSSGNHAQAVALASSLLGIKSIIVMPKNAPKVKVDATIEYGADVVRCDNNLRQGRKLVKIL